MRLLEIVFMRYFFVYLDNREFSRLHTLHTYKKDGLDWFQMASIGLTKFELRISNYQLNVHTSNIKMF